MRLHSSKRKEKGMICVITTAKITPGYGSEAWEWARGLAKLAKDKYNLQGDLLQCTAGDNYVLTIVAKHESHAAREEFDRRFFQDPEYHEIEKKRTGPTFSDMRTSIYNVVEV